MHLFGRERISFIVLIAALAMGIVGCGMLQKREKERTPVDFTVVKPEDYPTEIREWIVKKGQEEFHVSWQNEGERYLLVGYGIQSTGGYSIQVDYVEETKDTIYLKTKLIGPEDPQKQKDAVSCPYIVVKIEDRDKKVVFECR